MKYEVVVAIYEEGNEDPVLEETVMETDDLAEATEELESMVSDEGGEDDEAEETGD